MILLVDAGNSRVKWGLWDGTWAHQEALPTGQAANLGQVWSTLPTPERILACTVAAPDVRTSLDVWAKTRKLAVRWVESQAEQLGVRNGYDDPRKLGADRWVALVAARDIVAGAALVVNAGTAVTIDALSADGEFLGGLIVPGIELMAEALAVGTAGLPVAPGEFREFPRRTGDAIATGAIHAVCGAIARMRTALLRRATTARVLLSGGAAQVLEAHLEPPVSAIPNLVLEGLRVIASKESLE